MGRRLQEGQLVLDWEGEEARVTEGRIRAGDGWLQLGGKASLGASPRLELTAQAERFAALSRVDRKLVVAGQSKLLLEGQRVQLEGQWRVLEGLWDISQSDAPTLDDDVVMPEMAAHASRSAAKQASTSPERSVQLQLGIDLGDKFRLKGKGMSILRSSVTGDMYIEVSVETPVNLTERQKELLREFEAISLKDRERHSPRSKSWFDKVKEFFEP